MAVKIQKPASETKKLAPCADYLTVREAAQILVLLFRSVTFNEVRNKIFSDTHMFISNEMNALNMILAYKDEEKS